MTDRDPACAVHHEHVTTAYRETLALYRAVLADDDIAQSVITATTGCPSCLMIVATRLGCLLAAGGELSIERMSQLDACLAAAQVIMNAAAN